jgi:alpha-ketoglutarate-dependent taurine dioxygenase
MYQLTSSIADYQDADYQDRTDSRSPVSATATAEVNAEFLPTAGSLPLVMKPAREGVDLADWLSGKRAAIESDLSRYGGILFRDFDLTSAAQFERTIRSISDDLLDYNERSSPRSRVAGSVYTSTDHPANQSIFLHNENSYQNSWPMKIFFFCATPAAEGGETPIADVRAVFARIPATTRERFIRKGWMYVRNFGEGFGLPWTEVFQTSDRGLVEQHCRKNGIELEWKDGNRLRTSAIRPAIANHPRTGETVWFNHATFFNVETLEPAVRDFLVDEFEPLDLPTNTFYGDRAPIEREVLDELRLAYQSETVSFAWKQGDLLVLDNMLVAHGRAPFRGKREILVAMAEQCSERGV